MVVYWDVVAAWNFLIDYLLLLCSLRLAGLPPPRVRMALSALLGAAYAAAQLWVPCQAWTLAPVLLAMCWIAFGGTGRFAKLTLLFCLLSCALGGGVVLLGTAFGSLYPLMRGVLYARLPWGVFFAAAALCYLLLTLVFRGGARHGGADLVRVRIEYRGRSVTLTLLRDTGNTLTDPLTGLGVPVVGAQAMAPLLGKETAAAIARGELPDGFTQLGYRAVGVPEGLLPAFRCDALSINGTAIEPRLIALSPHVLSDGSGFQGLWCAGEKGERNEQNTAVEETA